MSIHRKALILSALVATSLLRAQTNPTLPQRASWDAEDTEEAVTNPMRADRILHARLRQIAESRLRQVAQSVAVQGLGNGFPLDVRSAEDLLQARIGFGFEVHTVAPSAVLAGSSLETEAIGTGHWRFVILVANRAVGLMDVARQDGAWTAVGFGGAGLARELDDLVSFHKANRAGSLRFIRIYQAGSDLLEVGTSSGARYVPMSAARASLKMALPGAGQGLVGAEELMPSLQHAVRSNQAAQH